MSQWITLIIFLIITAGAASFGATNQPGKFYDDLRKPSWNPPAWLFGPVWTILYIMIAIAGWLVWRQTGLSVVLGVWAVQILLNALWSVVAFRFNRLDYAFYNIAALWLSIILFMVLAWPVDRIATYLFMPYLLWVSFASWLNLTLWRLNPVA